MWPAFYRNGITRLAEQDAYAGYIVSLHAEALLTQGKGLLSYMPDYTVYQEVRGFLREQESYREALMTRLKESPEYRARLIPTAATGTRPSSCARTMVQSVWQSTTRCIRADANTWRLKLKET